MFKINDRVEHSFWGSGHVTGHLDNLIGVNFRMLGTTPLVSPEDLTRVENDA